MSFVHNPAPNSSIAVKRDKPSFILGRLISQGSLSRVSSSRLLDALGLGEAPVPVEGDQVVITSPETFEDILDEPLSDGTEEDLYEKYVRSSRLFARELKLSPGQQVLVVNGRVG